MVKIPNIIIHWTHLRQQVEYVHMVARTGRTRQYVDVATSTPIPNPKVLDLHQRYQEDAINTATHFNDGLEEHQIKITSDIGPLKRFAEWWSWLLEQQGFQHTSNAIYTRIIKTQELHDELNRVLKTNTVALAQHVTMLRDVARKISTGKSLTHHDELVLLCHIGAAIVGGYHYTPSTMKIHQPTVGELLCTLDYRPHNMITRNAVQSGLIGMRHALVNGTQVDTSIVTTAIAACCPFVPMPYEHRENIATLLAKIIGGGDDVHVVRQCIMPSEEGAHHKMHHVLAGTIERMVFSISEEYAQDGWRQYLNEHSSTTMINLVINPGLWMHECADTIIEDGAVVLLCDIASPSKTLSVCLACTEEDINTGWYTLTPLGIMRTLYQSGVGQWLAVPHSHALGNMYNPTTTAVPPPNLSCALNQRWKQFARCGPLITELSVIFSGNEEALTLLAHAAIWANKVTPWIAREMFTAFLDNNTPSSHQNHRLEYLNKIGVLETIVPNLYIDQNEFPVVLTSSSFVYNAIMEEVTNYVDHAERYWVLMRLMQAWFLITYQLPCKKVLNDNSINAVHSAVVFAVLLLVPPLAHALMRCGSAEVGIHYIPSKLTQTSASMLTMKLSEDTKNLHSSVYTRCLMCREITDGDRNICTNCTATFNFLNYRIIHPWIGHHLFVANVVQSTVFTVTTAVTDQPHTMTMAAASSSSDQSPEFIRQREIALYKNKDDIMTGTYGTKNTKALFDNAKSCADGNGHTCNYNTMFTRYEMIDMCFPLRRKKALSALRRISCALSTIALESLFHISMTTRKSTPGNVFIMEVADQTIAKNMDDAFLWSLLDFIGGYGGAAGKAIVHHEYNLTHIHSAHPLDVFDQLYMTAQDKKIGRIPMPTLPLYSTLFWLVFTLAAHWQTDQMRLVGSRRKLVPPMNYVDNKEKVYSAGTYATIAYAKIHACVHTNAMIHDLTYRIADIFVSEILKNPHDMLKLPSWCTYVLQDPCKTCRKVQPPKSEPPTVMCLHRLLEVDIDTHIEHAEDITKRALCARGRPAQNIPQRKRYPTSPLQTTTATTTNKRQRSSGVGGRAFATAKSAAFFAELNADANMRDVMHHAEMRNYTFKKTGLQKVYITEPSFVDSGSLGMDTHLLFGHDATNFMMENQTAFPPLAIRQCTNFACSRQMDLFSVFDTCGYMNVMFFITILLNEIRIDDTKPRAMVRLAKHFAVFRALKMHFPYMPVENNALLNEAFSIVDTLNTEQSEPNPRLTSQDVYLTVGYAIECISTPETNFKTIKRSSYIYNVDVGSQAITVLLQEAYLWLQNVKTQGLPTCQPVVSGEYEQQTVASTTNIYTEMDTAELMFEL